MAPVEALNPVAGLQLYVLAPEAVIFVEEPLQMAADTGVTVKTGTALTVIVWLWVPVHPEVVPEMV